MKKILRRITFFSIFFSQSLMALTLNEARMSGRVGETLNGYIAPRQQDKETFALVKSVNYLRSEYYRQIAESNHVTTDSVARLAGQKLVARAKHGEYVRGINGRWMKR